MKKFLCVLTLCVVVMSVPTVSFARSSAERIGENVLSNVLSTIITDAIRKSGKGGDVILNPENSENKDTKRMPEIKSKSNGIVTELSDEQFQSFSEICLAGSFEEFRKKIEYENISHEATYTKEDGSVVTLRELAKTSPNPELAEFLNEDKEDKTEE